MTKEELIEKVSSGAGLSKADAGRALNAIVNSITSSMQRRDLSPRKGVKARSIISTSP